MEVLLLHLRYQFNLARTTRQQQQDCIMQHSVV